MAESTDSSAINKELEIEHNAGYRSFLKVSQVTIVLIVIALVLMAIFLL